jgi:hypothetical protein
VDNYNYSLRLSVNARGTKVLFNSNFGLFYQPKKSSYPNVNIPYYVDVYELTVPSGSGGLGGFSTPPGTLKKVPMKTLDGRLD